MRMNLKTVSLTGLLLAPFVFSTSLITAQQAPLKTSSQKLIQLFVTVTNGKQFVSGLNQESFQVFVDKDSARIVDFREAESAASIGILLDFSGSMPRLGSKSVSSERLGILQQPLSRFFELNNKSNEYFVVGIRDTPELLVDWTADATAIVNKMSGVQPKGPTALFDACRFAVEKVQQGRHPKRALILLTDGLDNNSRYSFNELRKLIRESGVMVYAMHTPRSQYAGTSLGVEGWAILDELSKSAGGLTYVSVPLKQDEANQILEAIAAELRHQYTITIEPLSQHADGKFHKIKVKVNPPADATRELKKLSARTREGFYAPQSAIKTPQP